MKFTKIMGSIICMILLACFLVSCDSAMDTAGNMDNMVDNDYSNGLVIDGIASSGSGLGSINSNKPTSKPVEDSSQPDSEQPEQDEYASKIIQTANLETQTKNFNNAIADVEMYVKELGGYIESSNITGNHLDTTYYQGRNAKYSLRIPANKLEDFLSYTESNLHIVSTTTTSTDVTVNYYDLKSRLAVLEAEKQALNNMLEKASTISEMLSIRNQLTGIISDIESIETQLRVYDNKVNYSTVTLRINEVVEYSVLNDEEPTWWSRIKEAFTESWSGFAKWWQNFSVWVVFAIPTLIIIAFFGSIIGTIVYFIIKRDKKLRKNEKDKHHE